MTVDLAAVRADVAALAAMRRDSAGPGERAAARWAAQRLRAAGAADVAVVPYRGRRSYGPSFAAHAAAGLQAARLRGPRAAALVAGALWSLERDACGDRVRRRADPLARRDGATVTARVPAAGRPRRTVVLVAHLDAARTGAVWSPRLQVGAERRRRTRTIPPALAPLALGLVLAATPLRRAGAALCALGVAGNLDVARPRTVPGANDNATGVAVVLDLVRSLAADPLPDTEALVVLPGGEEAGMDGFAAWLRARRPSLDAAHTLVLGLDTLGCGTPVVLRAEGALRTHRYDPAVLDRVDAAADRASLPRPERWRIPGWTDPLVALRDGLAAVSLLSIGPAGHFTHYHLPSDVPAHVDWHSVEGCARLAAAVLRG